MDRLTRPRKQILTHLVEFSYLSTQDFYRLLPNESPSEESHGRRVRRLLYDFAALGYIHSFPLIDIKRSGRFPCYQNIYWFSSKGLELAQEQGLENGDGKANDDHSPRTLAHEYEISRFHIGLKDLALRHGPDLYWQQKDLKRTVNPDAMFAIAKPDGAFYYFLEIEKSKLGRYVKGEPQIIRKLVRYYDYYNSDQCLQEWGDFKQFRVIVVVQTEERRQNLLKHLSELYKHRMFWVSTEEDYLNFLTPKDFEERVTYSLVPQEL